MEPDTLPLYEILGMTQDELEDMSREFASMVGTTEDLFALCRLLVDKYGLEAVFMSISLFRVMEMAKSKRRRRTMSIIGRLKESWMSDN